MNSTFLLPAEMTEAVQQILAICRLAWEKGFMAGWSGNASVRLSREQLLITSSGSPKGLLKADDCLLINLKGEKLAGKAKASSESGLHARLYETFPEVKAILHTHPTYLQALELSLQEDEKDPARTLREKFLNVKLYEATVWRRHLRLCGNFPPGSVELAENAGKALKEGMKTGELALPQAIWLSGHGLCALGEKLQDCLCLTEEMEHIAHVQLLSSRNI